MNLMLLRRATIFRGIVNSHFPPNTYTCSLMILRDVHNQTQASCHSRDGSNDDYVSSCYDRNLHHSPLFSSIPHQSKEYKVDIVDDETWQVSTGFASVRRDTITTSSETSCFRAKEVNYAIQNSKGPDFDEIEDMRMCGKLFYKLDKDSKEFEEYNYDFHRRKSSGKKGQRKERKPKENPNSNSPHGLAERKHEIRESKMRENPRKNVAPSEEIGKLEDSCIEKKQKRTPTFNQLTGPYHEPFCLDIYISKASVRACIIHRATSKVVSVAHSISKDMKFDLGSTKNAVACAAVGKILAQRALADDIHNVVYTPRKGEKLEGKLQIVLQSVMKNGVSVKVKIKQKKVRKDGFHIAAYKRSGER